jgi:hypothetical protein
MINNKKLLKLLKLFINSTIVNKKKIFSIILSKNENPFIKTTFNLKIIHQTLPIILSVHEKMFYPIQWGIFIVYRKILGLKIQAITSKA